MVSALRVIVIEDSPSDAELMILALRAAGLDATWERVETADELRAALTAGRWDLVLSDYAMPEFGAAAALEIVRAADLDLPFLVVSGMVGEDVAVALMRAGANDYLIKDHLARLAPAIEREVREAGNRRAKRRAERTATHLAAVVESSDDAIISKTLDGVITSWNAAAEHLYGWTAAEAIGQNISFQVPPDKVDELAENMSRLRAGERVGYFETVRMHRDGRRIDVALTISRVRDADGRLVGVSKTARDIRDRKRAEEALRCSEERYRGLIESIPALVWVYDAAGRAVLHNHRWYEYTGQSPDAISANRWHEALHPDDVAGAVAAWDHCTATGEPYATEYRIRRTDGVYRWFLAQATAHSGPGGIEQWCGICTDIDDRKRAEQRLKTQHAVVSILAQALDLKELVPQMLRAVCETTGWDVGDFWVVDRLANVLTPVDLWHVEGLDIAEFRDLSLRSTFGPGVGLPGRVWVTVTPEWIVDISRDAKMRRAAAAAKAGLRGGFAFPIQFGPEVLGVAEFFSRECRPPDEELLRMFASFGSQIGQFIERIRVKAGLQLFRTLIDQTTDGIEVIDPQTGRFLDVNETACLAHGYSREEYLKLSVADIDPLVAAESWAVRRVAGRLAGAQTLESLHRRKDGSTFQVEVSFNTIHLDRDFLVAVVRDITERKQSVEALRQSEALMAAIVHSALDCIVTMDTEGRIVEFNPAAERAFGHSRGAVLGKAVGDVLIPPSYRDGHARGLAHYLATGEGPVLGKRLELAGLRADGTEFSVELSIIPLEINGRRHFTAFLRDLTDRKQLEDQFRHAQKMEAVGQLAAGVAHDFNNLLTVINGYSDLLLESVPPSDPSRNMIAEIHKAGDRSAGLTRQLLAFSRRQVLAPRVLDLNGVVTDTEKMLHRLLGEDVRLTVTLTAGLWPVRADPGQVEQVLMNLAVNARDAMPQGGQLTIETRNVELDETYSRTQSDARAGPHVLLSVTDSGSGMPPEVKARVFEPFFTTKEPGKGTGLGLATAYGIVKQSSGHIAVYSEVGVGTTFKVYLPRTDHPVDASTARAERPAKPRGKETVLLVEDENGVRALTRYILAGCGYTVLEAADGVEAGRVAVGHDGPIHLLVTDVVMPGAGGRAVAEQIAKRYPDVKVLFISGYTDDAIIRHGVLREGVNFLQKPFSPASLAFKVREVLDAPAGCGPD